MVHNFFKRNKKKAVISTVILSLLALSVCVVCIYNSKILAGVFQSHKNEDGTISYVQKNTIEILEIVAQDGQQVLGYTVEGSEPIKPEQIQAYTGSIDHDEFLNATGYDVSGSPGNYIINSAHNGTFNENVLSGMMYTEDDQIIVNVVMASALTEDDIKNADLIYINNPADNDENLLYYYDKIVNNGKNGIAKGDKGCTYTGSIEEQIAVKEYAVDKICKAAGRRGNAEKLTVDDFKKAEAENFYDYNIEGYINEIAELQRDSLNGSNTDESVSKITEALGKINQKLKDAAIDVIKNYVKPGSIAEEDREKLIIAFKQRGYSNFYEVNEQDYVDFIVSTKRTTDAKINGGMSQINDKNCKAGRDLLKDIKNGVDIKADSTDDEYIALVSKSIAQLFYSSETYNKLNAEAYAVKFIEDEAAYDTTQNDVFIQELEDNIISVVNAEEKETALTTLAELAANKAETDNLKNNINAADRLFMLSELEEYKSFNIERYLDAIGDLTNPKALVSTQENEDGTWSEKYSEDKMNALLKSVNDSLQTIGISCDIPWNIAMKLYEYVTINGRALTYNAELLTSKTIGDYTNPNEEKNSNSMYKFLLVLRQMTPEYFRNTVLPRIDGDGNYDDGTGSGLNGKWYAGTFCSAWNNESVADKNNFCEPSVVGKLYDTAGNVIGNTSYIKDNIFSFSGNQFFGGKKFYVDTEDYNEVAGSFTISKVEYQESSIQSTKATKYSNTLLCAELPENAKNVYCFVGNSGWYDFNRSATVDISGYSDGTIIKLSLDRHTLSEYPRQKDWDGWAQYNNPNANYIVYRIDSIEDGKIPSNPPNSATKKIYFDVSAISYWDTLNTIVHFTTVTENVVNESIDKTKGEILREIMGISLNQLQSMPFKVLEIQPDGNVNEFNSYDGAVRLADYLRIDVPNMNSLNWEEYFEIEPISIREFNTRHEELNGTYDLIYFGTKTKYMSTKEYKHNGEKFVRTDYGNSMVMGEAYYMNGLVYTGIGQQRQVGGSLRGTVASDYYTVGSLVNHVRKEHDLWTKYFFAEFSESGSNNYLDPGGYYLQKSDYVNTRMTGNDLTVARMDDLLEYVKAGYPVLFADGLLNSDEDFINANTMTANGDVAVKWKYLDNNSKLYAFIQQAKELGKDSSGQYTDTSALYDNKPYASLVSVKYAKYGKNPDKLAAAEKFNGGLSFAVKRNVQVDFEYIKGPQEYDRDTSGNMLPMGSLGTYITDSNSCICVLKPNIVRENVMEWINDNYSFRFLIDKSGTANFPANQTIELDVYSYFDEKRNEITVSTRNGKWPTGLEGFIPWKVEAISKNNSGNRWTYVGYSAFKKSEPDPVRVLWVKSQADGNGAVNGSTLDFKHMMDKYDGKLPGSTDYIPEYDIRVDTIPYKSFVSNWNNVSQEEKDNPYDKNRSRLKINTLNGIADKGTEGEGDKEYDMIVIGYSDSYDTLDIDNIYCLNNIDYFVNKAGHSMLFAHDNASFITSFNYYTNAGGGTSIYKNDYNYYNHGFVIDFARYTTSYMRGMLGMDAYGSSYSPLAFNAANTDTDKEYLSWLYKYTPSVYNARTYITDNPANPTLDELSDMRGYVDGQILWYSTSYQSWPLIDSGMRIGDNKYGEWVNTKGIECTNKGQIAIYPFVIGDSLTVDSETHFQYTKLDIENKDTTVWYTLANSGTSPYYDATKGDGSNNYYIYSNGNITYTGAGHRFIADDAKECLLFVNTVVAAIKLGSLAPDVTYPDAVSVNGEDVLYGYDTDSALKVTFKATDYDVLASGAYAFVDAQIFLDKDNNGKYDPAAGDVLLNSPAKMPGGGTYLRDQNGASINIDGTDIVNRQDTTFYLDYDDLAGIYDSLGLEPKTKNIDKVKALFDNSNNYRICVNVLSKLQEDKAKKEAADLSTVKDYYQYANARVILRALHDLR
ncbi:MAG: DUF5057 domain-containing protein [Lachnospiraceae bacterium]|nr:DUF5057 domain-containing protein [Lachnospiraceae bacterium]